MWKLLGERFLARTFSQNELNILLQKKDFVERRERVETLEEFEQLCLLGFQLLGKGKSLN